MLPWMLQHSVRVAVLPRMLQCCPGCSNGWQVEDSDDSFDKSGAETDGKAAEAARKAEDDQRKAGDEVN